MPSTVILGTARTPFGKMGGTLSSLDATDLGGHAIEAALERSGVDPEQVEQVVFGQVLQAGQGQIPSRQAQIKGGIPKEVPSETINKVCASGMRSLGIADMAIRAGDTEVAVTGGMESMSQAPYLLPGARFGFRMGDVSTIDAMIHDGLTNPFTEKQMINEASEVSNELEITRVDMDRFAERSHRLAAEATDAGRLADEIAGVTVKSRKGENTVEADEAIRPETTVETLAKLRAIGGEDATHTAGNAPGVNDGAGAIVVASEEWAEKEGRTPLARVLSYGTVADDFAYLARTPANAAKQALEKIGKSPEDVDLWEINEAFASVAINSVRMLDVDEEKVNVNGGAIALGHPIGASGARIVGSLVHELRRRGGGLGVAAICSGGGQGDAIVIEVDGSLAVSRAAAFFDLDKTLMAGSTGMQFARVATRHGLVSRRQLASWGVRAPALPPARHHRRAHHRGAARRPRADLAGFRRADFERMNPEVMAAILPRVYPQMLDEVHAHQDAGRADLHRQRRRQRRGRVAGHGARHGRRDRHPLRGRRRRQLTGRFDGPFVYGEGKVEAMQAFAAEHEHRPRRLLRLLGLDLRPADAARGRQPGRRQPRPAAGARSPATRAGRRCASSASAAACVAVAITLLATVAGFGASRVAARRKPPPPPLRR